MTMADMEALHVECTEGLGSDYSSTDSDSDNEIKWQMRRKKKPGLLIADYDQSNPYNRSCVVGNSETKPIFNSCGFQFGIISPPPEKATQFRCWHVTGINVVRSNNEPATIRY